MRLITRFELATRTDSELAVLFRDVTRALARSGAATPERRNALATLENIARERADRHRRGPGP